MVHGTWCLSMTAAFVTGGGGYLGSKLCRELARRGYSVTAFDLNFLEEELEAGVTHIQVGNAVFM